MAFKKCPNCQEKPTALFRPFCSKRCQLIDLGQWFGERYAVPQSLEAQEELPQEEKG